MQKSNSLWFRLVILKKIKMHTEYIFFYFFNTNISKIKTNEKKIKNKYQQASKNTKSNFLYTKKIRRKVIIKTLSLLLSRLLKKIERKKE